jgi:hypothetical protein
MSKPLLNDPGALFPNKAFVQRPPFDAGSLGLSPLAPNGTSPLHSTHKHGFQKKDQLFFD